MVYEEILVDLSSSSPSLVLSREYISPPCESKVTEPGEVPAVHLLRTSRIINEEASLILYSRSIFVVRNHIQRPSQKELMRDLSLFFGAAQFEKKPSGVVELGQRFCQKLISDVARAFEPKRGQLPLWLFGGYYTQCEPVPGRIAEGVFPSSLGPFPGYIFPAFLREIGPSNTAKIKELEFVFPHLSRACQDFPIYAEIVRQHIRGLKKLTIRKFQVHTCNRDDTSQQAGI